MLWVLKKIVSMRQFSWVPKNYVKTDWLENIYNFTLKFFAYLNLCYKMYVLSGMLSSFGKNIMIPWICIFNMACLQTLQCHLLVSSYWFQSKFFRDTSLVNLLKEDSAYESTLFVLFDLILYVPSTICQLNRDGSSWVEPVLS